jgi:hypothetical protein
MKSASLFISILLLAYNIHAQRYAISNEKMNIVYVDIDNPIHVMVEGLPANKLKVTTENGTIHPDTNHADIYDVKPDFQGECDINIYALQKDSLNSLRLIGQMKFRAKRLPPAVAQLCVYKPGRYNKTAYGTEIPPQPYQGDMLWLLLNQKSFDYNVVYEVDSFKIKLYHHDSLIWNHVNKGYLLDTFFDKEFMFLTPGDKVVIDEIKGRISGGASKLEYLFDRVQYRLDKDHRLIPFE